MRFVFWLVVGTFVSLAAAAQEVTLTRLDCGNGTNDPRRFSEFGMVDPGFALYARSFLARGRLYEELNELLPFD